jgi:hypothetical protein
MSISRLSTFGLACLLAAATLLQAGPAAELHKSFQNPPDNARIMMRWWWFGPGVTKAELENEMRMMKAGGIGGFEVQPVYPLAPDDPQVPFKNLPYLSDAFLDAVRFTSEKSRELGLRMDMTLCSGWPYGGPHVPISQASANLRIERIPIAHPAAPITVPNIAEGEKLIAVFLVHSSDAPQPPTTEAPARGRARRGPPPQQFDPNSIRQLAVQAGNLRLTLPSDIGSANEVLFFISSRTGQQVKRPSIGSEGYVLDHYDRAAVENHLKTVGDRLMQAFGTHPPYAVFSDSLEVYAADWTPNFLNEFKQRRGYDLTPSLPALAGDIGPKTLVIRHDWAQTLTELVDENYLTPIDAWAKKHGTKFRSQTYGYPPVMMSSNRLVALPEGEGTQWRSLSSTRWASSASHLYNRPVTSSETWTWLHSPVFRATPLDMKAEADLHFLEGINQLIGHGWPYSPQQAGEPGWRFYAAAVFNYHNPWWLVMPDITKYLQRASFALRQGKPSNDVAIYLATDDAWAHMANGQATINDYLARAMNPEVVPQVLDAGYNFDFIDDPAIASAGIPFKALILPAVERIPPESVRKIEAYVKAGGKVFLVGTAPAGVPGQAVPDVSTLGKQLTAQIQPDFAVTTSQSAIGVVHRKLEAADLYFVVNTSNQAVHTEATVRMSGRQPQWWDAMSGEAYRAEVSGTKVKLDLEPYESRFLVYSSEPVANAPALPGVASGSSTDLSTGWKVTLGGASETMDKLHSWADDPQFKFFSGQATYEKSIDVPASMANGHELVLDFGEGTPLPVPARTSPGMHALMESPVHEAAVVYVNGEKAGVVWHPPYQLNVTKQLHAGANTLRIVAGNLALNEMAGEALPNYKLLNVRYGERFQAQDMDQIQPLPSGLTGGVKLIAK